MTLAGNIETLVGDYEDIFNDTKKLIQKKIELFDEESERLDKEYAKLEKQKNDEKEKAFKDQMTEIKVERATYDVEFQKTTLDVDKRDKIKKNSFMTKEFENFVLDMNKVLSKTSVELKEDLSKKEVLELDDELARLYLLSEFLSAQDTDDCSALNEFKVDQLQEDLVKAAHKEKDPKKKAPLPPFENLYVLKLKDIINIDKNFDMAQFRKIDPDGKLEYYLFKQKGSNKLQVMVKDPRDNSFKMYTYSEKFIRQKTKLIKLI